MRKSTMVTVGVILAAGISFACAADPDQEFMDEPADHQEMCVEDKGNGEYERHPDDECEDEHRRASNGLLWYYLGRAYGSPPPYGSSFKPGSHGTTVKPTTGTVARPPSTGGFGTTRVSVGE